MQVHATASRSLSTSFHVLQGTSENRSVRVEEAPSRDGFIYVVSLNPEQEEQKLQKMSRQRAEEFDGIGFPSEKPTDYDPSSTQID
jgi:hypothetical protein